MNTTKQMAIASTIILGLLILAFTLFLNNLTDAFAEPIQIKEPALGLDLTVEQQPDKTWIATFYDGSKEVLPPEYCFDINIEPDGLCDITLLATGEIIYEGLLDRKAVTTPSGGSQDDEEAVEDEEEAAVGERPNHDKDNDPYTKPKDEPYCDEVSDDYRGYCWDRNAGDPRDNPYCDEVSDDYNGGCWDRKDYDQETGLYPCKDGSYVGDWRDCDDDRNDEGSDGGDEENSDEETENCGGEPCTATEKEDSWLEDETEYYEEEPECFENNDGALGDPIPCE